MTALGDAVSYELRLYDGTTNAQLGNTLAGSLQPFQQFRYLDVFAQAGVAAGDRSNVRAEFGNLTGAQKKLIGFCTVQENTALAADFRIAKSYGGTPQNAFVQGGNAFGSTALLGTTDNQPLDILVNNQRVMRYAPNVTSPNLVGGHPNNSAGASGGQTIGGGSAPGTCFDPPTGTSTRSCGNTTTSTYTTVGGGIANRASGFAAAVAGGDGNTASNTFSVVAGGSRSTASGVDSTVAGGYTNRASGVGSTVAGGEFNAASGDYSAVSGGSSNTANGVFGSVAGGTDNVAGARSLAAGSHARAANTGCFVWADSSSGAVTSCFGNNEFIARSVGGFYFFTGGVSDATYTGAQLPPGAGGWSVYSDRASKRNIASVDPLDVLNKLVSVPIATWNWSAQGEGIRHLGPMAQDFHAAFGLGESDKRISTVDADGVALAAIQGLHSLVRDQGAKLAELLKAKEATIGAQQRQIDALTERLAAFERLRADVAMLKTELASLHQERRLTAVGFPVAATPRTDPR